MFIQTETTPNPSTVKFIPGGAVMTGGKTADFPAKDQAGRSPLAQRLFRIDGVDRVFLGSDFVSVTKTDAREWLTLKPMIMAALFEHFTTNQPVIDDTETKPKSAGEEDDPVVAQIKELLETRIRPAVAQDGGDIEFHDFDRGIVYLSMRGACAGCPSSTMTLKMGIENMLRHYVPDVLEVRAVQD